MKFKYLILTFFIFIISSCNKKRHTDNPKNDSINLTVVDTAAKSNIIIDSSKMVKAVDNIYFGSDNNSNVKFNKNYEINNTFYKYDLGYYKIHPKYGLYQFLLASCIEQSKSECLKDVENLKYLINKKYSDPIKIFSKPAPNKYDELTKSFIDFDKTHDSLKIYPPPDDRFINYIFEWKKNDISIKAGIRTQYGFVDKNGLKIRDSDVEPRYDYGTGKYKKEYKVVLLFTYEKILKIEEDVIQKDKINQRKKVLEQDVKKF